MNTKLFFVLAFFSVKFFAMEQEKQLPTTLKRFTDLPRDLQIEIVLLSADVPHASDDVSLRKIIHFLRTSKMRYYDNAEFVGELLKNLYQKRQQKRFREGLSFAHFAADLRTSAAGCALKNYLAAHPEEKDEVESIFRNNFDHDYQWLKIFADSGININAGFFGDNALLRSARSNQYATTIPKLLSLGVDINSADDEDDNALMLLIANHGNSAVQTARLLVDKGIDLGHKNMAGYTAMDYAVRDQELHIMDLLSDIKP